MLATLRGMGRDIGDIDAWLTSWDYPTLAGTMARTVLEELPQSLKLLRIRQASAFDGRRLDQMTRSPKFLARQFGLAEACRSDLHAASRQSCLVPVRGFSVCR